MIAVVIIIYCTKGVCVVSSWSDSDLNSLPQRKRVCVSWSMCVHVHVTVSSHEPACDCRKGKPCVSWLFPGSDRHASGLGEGGEGRG